MTPRIRTALFTVTGCALALVIGLQLADQDYVLSGLVAIAAACLVVSLIHPAPIEVWLVGAAVFGYVVGNRGFAQLQLLSQYPILPAEGVLVVAVPALVLRLALGVGSVRRDAVNMTLAIWMLLGAVRLPLDLGEYGVLALRDFALVYYALFFFVAQDLGSRAGSLSVLRRFLTAAFVVLIPVVICNAARPDLLASILTWNQIPLIFHKSDLIATSLVAGFFWLWTRWDSSRRILWLIGAGASLLLVGVMASPRAAMFADAVVTALFLMKGRWRILAFQAGVVAAGSAVALLVMLAMGKDLKTSAPYSMYEHAVSIFDTSGTGVYVNGESGDPGDNNRFRIVWWKDVLDEVSTSGPVLGLGFGHDLLARFLADYGLVADEEFAARSPHCVFVTVAGRMGLVGSLAWLAVVVSIGSLVWRIFGTGDAEAIGLGCVVAVTGISASFGVVLEGPMGAVIFWTALGLAKATLESKSDHGKDPLKPGAVERSVANADEIASHPATR
jgi:hypothetical protein